jgi:hypothetical protein
MENKNFELSKDDTDMLIKTVKKYCNLFKALYMIDPAAAAEFKKKQEYFYNEKHKDHKDHHHEGGGCCSNKLDNKCKYYLTISLHT